MKKGKRSYRWKRERGGAGRGGAGAVLVDETPIPEILSTREKVGLTH